MNKEQYLSEFFSEMRSYILDRKVYALLVEQGLDVINSFEEDYEKNIGSPKELTEELFELNDITIPLKKEKKNCKIFNTIRLLFGFMIILIGINVILNLPIIYTMICILMLLLIVMFFANRFILGGTFLFIIFLIFSGIYKSVLAFPIQIVIMLLLLYIGIRMVFFPRRHYAHLHAKAASRRQRINELGKYQNSDIKVEDNNEEKEGSISVENSFSDTRTALKDQEINLILVDNRFGNLDLDFTNFSFPRKDVTIDVENNFGKVTIIKNKNIRISTQVDSLAGNLNTRDGYYENENEINMIYIVGRNRFGEVKVKNSF